jgi:hypothetical protein
MMSLNKGFYLKIFIFGTLTLSPLLRAQLNISLPEEIRLIVNGSVFNQTPDWMDSLNSDAAAGKIYYNIIGANSKESTVITQIQVPQILSLNAVFRQIILYYSLLQDEKNRQMEQLHVYPYFESSNSQPAIICRYTPEGTYHIDVNAWNRVPVPPQPIVENRDIFNQILQVSFEDIQSIGDVSNSVFEKVAAKNHLSVKRIKEIYQNTILWQLGSQIYPESHQETVTSPP